jgi:hypothetical protein
MPTAEDKGADATVVAQSGQLAPRCVICCEPIIVGARKCNKCDSFQDWTRYVFRWSGLIAAIIALLPVWSIAVSLWRLAVPSEAKIHVSVLKCSRQEIDVAAANVGQRTGVIKSVAFEVVRNPPQSAAERDIRTLNADGLTPIKPSDTIIIKYKPSSEGFEELPIWQDSKACKYKLKFDVLGSGEIKSADIIEPCDCPR